MSKPLRILDRFPFEFYGKEIYVALATDRNLYVPVRSLCKALGIDINPELTRIEHDAATSDSLAFLIDMTPQENGGARKAMHCLSLEHLPYWLISIDTSHIRDEKIRSQVVRYKQEFAEVAWRTFGQRILPEYIYAGMNTALSGDEYQFMGCMPDW